MFPKPEKPTPPEPAPIVADAGMSNSASATRKRTSGAAASLISSAAPTAPVAGKSLMGQ